MNTKIYLLILCFLVPLSNVVLAQSAFQLGGLPSINLNYKLKNNWSLNYKIESRQRLQSGTFNGERDKSYEYVLTDNSLIAAKKVGLNSRISVGYLLRLREGEVIQRFIQQYAISKKLPGLKLAHRFVADQTFSPVEATEYRFRYRLATEIPLNGQSTDPKEFYLKISNEYLNSMQSAFYDLEVRLVSLMGYVLAEKHKIECGLDYRVNSFLNRSARHSFWWSMNWYVEI